MRGQAELWQWQEVPPMTLCFNMSLIVVEAKSRVEGGLPSAHIDAGPDL